MGIFGSTKIPKLISKEYDKHYLGYRSGACPDCFGYYSDVQRNRGELELSEWLKEEPSVGSSRDNKVSVLLSFPFKMRKMDYGSPELPVHHYNIYIPSKNPDGLGYGTLFRFKYCNERTISGSKEMVVLLKGLDGIGKTYNRPKLDYQDTSIMWRRTSDDEFLQVYYEYLRFPAGKELNHDEFTGTGSPIIVFREDPVYPHRCGSSPAWFVRFFSVFDGTTPLYMEDVGDAPEVAEKMSMQRYGLGSDPFTEIKGDEGLRRFTERIIKECGGTCSNFTKSVLKGYYMALFSYVRYEMPKDEQSFVTILSLAREAKEIADGDSDDPDYLKTTRFAQRFADAKKKDSNCIAARRYDAFMMGTSSTISNTIRTGNVMLQEFWEKLGLPVGNISDGTMEIAEEIPELEAVADGCPAAISLPRSVDDSELVDAIGRINRDYAVFCRSGCTDTTGKLEGYYLPVVRKFVDEYCQVECQADLTDEDNTFCRKLREDILEMADTVGKICLQNRRGSASSNMIKTHAEIDMFLTGIKVANGLNIRDGGV